MYLPGLYCWQSLKLLEEREGRVNDRATEVGAQRGELAGRQAELASLEAATTARLQQAQALEQVSGGEEIPAGVRELTQACS